MPPPPPPLSSSRRDKGEEIKEEDLVLDLDLVMLVSAETPSGFGGKFKQYAFQFLPSPLLPSDDLFLLRIYLSFFLHFFFRNFQLQNNKLLETPNGTWIVGRNAQLTDAAAVLPLACNHRHTYV